MKGKQLIVQKNSENQINIQETNHRNNFLVNKALYSDKTPLVMSPEETVTSSILANEDD